MKQDLNRRKFLKTGVALSLAPAALLTHNRAFAQSGQLDPENPQAVALAYTHESTVAGQNCANCQLYTGTASAEWGPCAIFPGQNVASAGWCKAWVAKA